jgi:RNA polymerase subunit RPABC4/transcription elongation factor Spt4
MRGEIQTRICRKCKNVADRNITFIKKDFSESDSRSDIEDRIDSRKVDIPFNFKGLTREEYIDDYLMFKRIFSPLSSYNVLDQNCSQCDSETDEWYRCCPHCNSPMRINGRRIIMID